MRSRAQPTPPACAPWEAGSKLQEAPSSEELIPGPGRPPLQGEPACSPHPTFAGDTHVPRECPGRAMTGLGESTPPPGAEAAAGSSGSQGIQGAPEPARRGRNAGSCLSQRPRPRGHEPRFGRGWAVRSAARRRRRRVPRAWAPRRHHDPRLAASASFPPAHPPRHLPQREDGEGATVPLGRGRRGDGVPRPFRSLQTPT